MKRGTLKPAVAADTMAVGIGNRCQLELRRWLVREVEVYRRQGNRLWSLVTLHPPDRLTSPLLPGFECQVREIFEDYLADQAEPEA